jgi:hypothetical protein
MGMTSVLLPNLYPMGSWNEKWFLRALEICLPYLSTAVVISHFQVLSTWSVARATTLELKFIHLNKFRLKAYSI